MLRQILEQLRQSTLFNRDAGDGFERLMCAYFKLDPQYVALFSGVWLWKDWPERQALGFNLPDTGIDLVAKLRDREGYCAIQCKFYESSVAMDNLGNFFTLSGKGGFTLRFIVATAALTKHAADALEGQQIETQLITLEDLEAAPIAWSVLDPKQPEQLKKLPPKTPREHQQEAQQKVIKGFETHDRGKLIMACGTGKTYTSLAIAEQMVGVGGHILFLVPSISLLNQSLRAWTADAKIGLRCFAVCSDTKAGKNEEDMRIFELAYPPTTNAGKLTKAMQETREASKLTVVFSTYQSIDIIHQMQQATGTVFDLIICDEAHRTTGYTQAGEDHSAFVRVHNNEDIAGKKRLYMTATPRFYAEATKNRAQESEIQVYSMDDVTTFGPEFHRLRFDEAVNRDLLSDYKVLIIAVDELAISQALNKRLSNQGDELKLDDAVKIVGCWNGIGKHVAQEEGLDISTDPQPMRTAIAFAQSIRHSKLLSNEFEKISEDLGEKIPYLPALQAQHVDGTMNVVTRNEKLSWLKQNIASDERVCRILTNARCLSEGVDVPALDAAIFLNPRDSVVDVVQSVGRVMRKAKGKKYGYVILPIGVRRDATADKALDDNRKYRVVWQVLNALRAHDDRLDKQFASLDLSGKSNGVVNVIGVGGTQEQATTDEAKQLGFAFDPQELEKWQDAIYAKIVSKCGDRRYLEDWAKDVAEIAQRHQARIAQLLEKPYSKAAKAFNSFLKSLRQNLNTSIDQPQAIEMLAQHIITKPVFDALFEGYSFTEQNPVSQSMQRIMDIIEDQALDKDHEVLEGFYQQVRHDIDNLANDPKGRQKIITKLYEQFFKIAFKRMAERLGIVYTPVEIVDFINHSVNAILQDQFETSLAHPNVDILDPFTGTGTFPVRLIESGLIPPEQLQNKYRNELHANDIILLAYYIAAINIEETYHRVTGKPYEPFPGIVLTDTFQMMESTQADVEKESLLKNTERVERQKARDIRVIVGNPPYSVGQQSGNDNNQNLKYPKLDERIAATYVANSNVTNKNSLYDSYIRAFRWASDRIGEQGVIGFVTNAGWVDGNAMDGFRDALTQEFSAIYVFNLRGNARTQGVLRQAEAGNVFGSGSRTPVAITLLVKKQGHKGAGVIHYHDIGDYLTREQKLEIISGFKDYRQLPWQVLEPNAHHDWINQRSDTFNTLIAFNDDPQAIFEMRSNGVQTNRDTWTYNVSQTALKQNMIRMIDFYNQQLTLHGEQLQSISSSKDRENQAAKLIDTDTKKIKWTSSLLGDFTRGKSGKFEEGHLTEALYRPYCKSWLYYDSMFNHRYKEKLYPTAHHHNLAIQVTGIAGNKDFSCLISNNIMDVQTFANGQCFPLYYYEKASAVKGKQEGLFENAEQTVDSDGFIKREGVSDVALGNFQSHYKDKGISKEDIFYYCYGVLHSPQFREQFAADLKKELPRIPYAPDFNVFAAAGRELAHWHLDYETVEPYLVDEDRKPQGSMRDEDYYRVEKMRFAGKASDKDKSTLVYNSRITLKNIPIEVYDYVVNGKSAIEWIMERYQITVDKDSGIKNDPNEWGLEHNEPEYILKLLKRVMRVSLETNRIVKSLPAVMKV